MRYDYNARGILRGVALACIGFAVLALLGLVALKHALPAIHEAMLGTLLHGFGL